MIQQTHFWIYTRGKRNHCLKTDMRTAVFTVAFFTVVKRMEATSVPVNRWIIKTSHTHTHTHECYSAIKKEGILPFAIEHHAKWSKSDRERHTLHDLTYMWRVDCQLPRWGRGGEQVRVIKECRLPVARWISSGDLTNSMVNTVNNYIIYTRKLLRKQLLECSLYTHTKWNWQVC